MPVPAIRAIAVDSLRFLYGARGFLRDDLPTEASGAQQFTQEFGRRACRRYARARGTLAGVSYSPIWSTVCDPYLDSISEGPTGGGNYASPFTGGQCAILYGWVVQVAAQPVNPQTTPPFSGTATANCAFGGIRGPLQLINRSVPGGLQLAFKVPIQAAAPDGYANLLTVDPATYLAPTATSINVTPCGGNPDNCGNPPPEYRPPTFPPNLPPLSPPTNPAPGFGNNWDVNILPDGQVSICIGGECSTGTPPGGGGGPDSGGGPGEPDGDPQETDPNDPNNPNEVSGCVEDGNILTGLKIEVTQAPPNYQGLGDIYYKSCWVWMGPSSDLLDMVIDGRTLESGQFVIPDSKDCTCFKVRANPGFKVSVQAYSRPKEE